MSRAFANPAIKTLFFEGELPMNGGIESSRALLRGRAHAMPDPESGVGRRATCLAVGSRPARSRAFASRAERRDPSRDARRDAMRVAVRAPFAALATAWLLFLVPAAANAESEDEVKAAFLFNFARYVEWPAGAFAGPDSSIRICLIGGDGFEAVLAEAVSGRMVGERAVEVAAIDGIDRAAGCHLLFFGEHAAAAGGRVADALGATPVFTISDREGFAEEGGIANFMLVGQKIRFAINPDAARRSGLRISSSLLRLATLVGEGGA